VTPADRVVAEASSAVADRKRDIAGAEDTVLAPVDIGPVLAGTGPEPADTAVGDTAAEGTAIGWDTAAAQEDTGFDSGPVAGAADTASAGKALARNKSMSRQPEVHKLLNSSN
jgi:hypothetical protein